MTRPFQPRLSTYRDNLAKFKPPASKQYNFACYCVVNDAND